MTVEDRLLFPITYVVSTENTKLAFVLTQSDWWHTVSSTILAYLLPDINHLKSFLGQRLKWISKPIARAFGHRGFTHGLLTVSALLATFYLKVPGNWFIPADTSQGMALGYLNHILADMLVPAGVPLLWPYR